MPQLVKKRRSGWAVLAVGALVASLLAVAASPVGAQDDDYREKADNATRLSACVGPAVEDQMFTDVSDAHYFKDAINCVAYYGITNGTDDDNSVYSPNRIVTRAEMAVFIARAAKVAGVDLGDAMDEDEGEGFTDIGDVWAEAQDAINRLASKGMIAAGGAFRPGDDITRAEMASFLIGLLVKASPTVSTNSSTRALQLAGETPGSVTTASAWNYFEDARSAVPAANDAEISALYELGIAKGRSAAAVQDDTKAPLDFNYEPRTTVNRGEMAAFITRALAHTSARPAGLSAQYVSTSDQIVVSARDADFQPRRDVVVDMFRIPTADAGLAMNANGTCSPQVEKIAGNYVCEIDNTDEETLNDGDIKEPLEVDEDTTVWVWTGDLEDTFDSDAERFRLDIPQDAAAAKPATRAHVGTDFAGSKVHLGSTVVYTVQLQSGPGEATSVGFDGEKPAKYDVRLSTFALRDSDSTTEGFQRVRAGSAISVTTKTYTTGPDGKVEFSVSAPADPAPTAKHDKFQVDILIAPGDNAPSGGLVIGDPTDDVMLAATTGEAIGFVTVRSGLDATDSNPGALTFSTERRDRVTQGVVVVTVKSAAGYVAASARGATNRVTVTVTDQYGDAISNASVMIASSDTTNVQFDRPTRRTASDGSRTFRYERSSATAVTETLTAAWDSDGDGCDASLNADGTTIYIVADNNCPTWDHDDNTDTAAIDGTGPIMGTAKVQWASAPSSTSASDSSSQLDTADGDGNFIIQAFDTDTNTIFVATVTDDAVDDDSVRVVSYDSNDRLNAKGATATAASAIGYAGFERALKKGSELTWIIHGSGSRTVNEFTVGATLS